MEEAGQPVRQAGALWHAPAALRGIVQIFGENATVQRRQFTPAPSCNAAMAMAQWRWLLRNVTVVMIEIWRCVHLLLLSLQVRQRGPAVTSTLASVPYATAAVAVKQLCLRVMADEVRALPLLLECMWRGVQRTSITAAPISNSAPIPLQI